MQLKHILLLSLAFAAGAGVSQARAALLVPGSSFLLTLETTANGGNEQSALIPVNGQPDQFNFGSVPVSVTASDTPISGGAETIAITIAATQDIFPSSTPGAGNWFMGIGDGSSPLQLSEPVTLTSALLNAIIRPDQARFPFSSSFSAISPSPRPGTENSSAAASSVALSTRRDSTSRRWSST